MNWRPFIEGVLTPPWLTSLGRASAAVNGPDLSAFPTGCLPSDQRTGRGNSRDRQAVEDATASRGKATAQLSAGLTDNRFPLAVWQPLVTRDLGATVHFKAVAGRSFAGAGKVAVWTKAEPVARFDRLEIQSRQ